MKEKLWYLYIIETENGKLYTGITTDIERRFNEHAGLKKGAKFTKANPPKRLVYQEEFSNRSLASKREIEIKKLSRQKKIDLFNK
ncbi:GIY-YIG nuclease family protein [Bacteriovorax sp. Seq25_V]|uniref:GIY-YIG nuclease family protein n=1 Tax=Bacteriovorax sp. Seq25_V TaxID=1201288 RepID=UPI000389F83E|nr:GIY-YIG nuclease family protein [Bacteriovorax sp. Seq25_V]EQC44700.1 GIY-YIG catalytic domain protein [Bacteriovorax sp. Seq25_V]